MELLQFLVVVSLAYMIVVGVGMSTRFKAELRRELLGRRDKP